MIRAVRRHLPTFTGKLWNISSRRNEISGRKKLSSFVAKSVSSSRSE